MASGAVVMPMSTSSGDSGITPSGASGGEADLGSFLSNSYDEAAVNSPGEPQAGEPGESLITDDLGEIPQEDPTATAQPQADTQPPQPGTEAVSPYKLTEDGKGYIVPKHELPQFQAAQKFFSEVSKHFATPQEAHAAAVQAADLRIMSNDFTSATDQGIDMVLRHWAGEDFGPRSPYPNPAMQQRYQQSFSKMATAMPNLLKQINPQAHDSMSANFLQSRIDSAYQRAAAEQRPEDYDANGIPKEDSPLRLAQDLDFGVNRKYKTDLSQVQKPQTQTQPQGPSPVDQRLEATFQRDLRADFMVRTEGEKFQNLRGEIDKLTNSVADRYPEKTMKAVKDSIHREIVDTIKAQKPEFWIEHEQEFRQLMGEYKSSWMKGDPNPGANIAHRYATYKQAFMQQAQKVMPSIVQSHINAATKAQENTARARNGQFAAGQKPAATTRTPAQPAAPANGKQPRLSPDDWQAELNRALQIR